ncbi:MAG: RNA polymerase-associated protein RapA [Nitrosomonas sp.]|nr:RNA polymerase-associated protein RapA [Nitrosomonas sp.]
MNEFRLGQRWICDADLQLGIGTIQAIEDRVISISFMAVGEKRTYAKHSAPLTLLIFSAGDTITSQDGRILTVKSVKEHNGLLIYVGADEDGNQQQLEEQQLADSAQFYRPTERLFNGHIDKNKWFRVRYQTLQQQQHLADTAIHGLTGCRTSLIPHQLYIAHEIANRYAPRVLLADEVGLGKTIEAGLILHHQLLTERANRVLIVVPETLVHQWLVEMLRRFNLHFSVFDEERCDVIEQSNEQENPFHSEQLILCSLDFLKQDPKRFQAALAGEWDLLIVDEAHHLEWSEETVSPEYTLIEQLAKHTKGVLLLTATPEQLGKASHFARLRLLDSDRFSSYETFVAEEQSYEPIAKAVEALLDTQPLDDVTIQMLISTIHDEDVQQQLDDLNTPVNSDQNKRAREILIARLLDQHGTGRILFRNTRATIKGFPGRKANIVPLPLPAQYNDALEVFETNRISDAQLLLCPELLYQVDENTEDPHWTEIDPRIDWLLETLIQLSPEKILVITASTQTALDIAQVIKTITGQHIPVFHEHMSLVARDRAAAFFADNESGCQLLVCSEIGSEGRNFQFAHHLVLFDLPLNPDLLEQRIGRLDRIGQTETINIHIPYIENSAQAVMLHWYHQGLNAFEQTCAAGQTVFLQVGAELNAALHQRKTNSGDFLRLINSTQSINQALNEALHKGRDKLLEYNSFRPAIASQLKQQALAQDADRSLFHYMDRIFDCFGVHTEEHRAGSYLIRPSEHMTTAFSGLSDDGMAITYNRDIALTNEDIHYLTWAHPMVVNAMDRVLSSEFGNAAVSAIQCKQIEPGTLLLESLFVLEVHGEGIQQSKRYLPTTIIRILIDENNTLEFDHKTLNEYQVGVSAEICRQVVKLKKESIKAMVSRSESLAQMQVPDMVSNARDQIQQLFTQEIERLQTLQKVNPNVRMEEIEFLQQQLKGLLQMLHSAHLRLDALRVIVAT